jgi:hypothetical protein
LALLIRGDHLQEVKVNKRARAVGSSLSISSYLIRRHAAWSYALHIYYIHTHIQTDRQTDIHSVE